MTHHDNIEGTLLLDGLIEGSPPSLPDVEDDLRDWERRVRRLGFPLSLSLDGNMLSVLAEKRPVMITELPDGAAEPAEAVAVALNSLLDIFPPQERGMLMSTVRSTEVRPGKEVQTIYAVGPDGVIHTQDRVVDAETTPPPQPLSRNEIIRMSIIGGSIALVLLVATGLIIHLISPQFWPNIFTRVKPFEASEVTVAANAYTPYFTIADADSKQGLYVLKLTREPAFPTTAEQRQALFAASRTAEDYRQKFAAEAVLRGYVTCEMFDEKGKFLSSTRIRIAELAAKETLDVFLPLPKEARPTRVVFGW